MTTATADRIAEPVPVMKRWPGCTMVLFGGGPSLTEDDVQYCFGKARTIAIKESYLLAPWADVLYSADDTWWKFYDGAPTFTGLKYAIFDEHQKPWPWSFKGLHILRNTGHHGVELDPTGLRDGYNSGYQAINLAVHLGATRIILLGFDCWSGPDGKSNWWTGQSKRLHLASPYPVFLQAFATLAEPLAALGVEVINCSRSTMLRAFPRMPLEEALP